MYYNPHLNIRPVNKEYASIKDVDDLYEKLLNCWCKDTCAPRMRDNWSINNKTCGQCSITAFLAQDIFGGNVYGVLTENNNTHCFNVVDNQMFDLTSEQFSYSLDYSKGTIQDRNIHFSKQEKYERYLYLKNKLNELL